MYSLIQDSGIDYADMSQHAPVPTHIKTHSLCLRLYEGNNGQLLFPRVKRTFRPQLHSKLWHHDNSLNTSHFLYIGPLRHVYEPFNHSDGVYMFGFTYVCPSVYVICLSVPCCLWPCLSECQRLLIGRLMDWADPVACCMQPFVAHRPTAQTLPVCGALLPPTKHHRGIVLFSTHTHKTHKSHTRNHIQI